MPESKKVIIKLDIHDENDKRKAFKAVSGLSGIESLSIDLKDNKLTVVGDVDPVEVVGKLKKKWHTDIVSVGPAKEPEKKPAVAEKKEGEKKLSKEEEEKNKKEKEQKEREEAFRRYMEATCRGYYNPYPIQRYCLHPVEEDPRGCAMS